MDRICASAARVHDDIAALMGNPLEMLRRMKFDPVGRSPRRGPLARTWSSRSTRPGPTPWPWPPPASFLLLHPDAGGFHLAPGAHMARELDIMSAVPGLVGAETFAAVDPRNNNKLEADLTKLAGRPETHRYVFFLSPRFPGARPAAAAWSATACRSGPSTYEDRLVSRYRTQVREVINRNVVVSLALEQGFQRLPARLRWRGGLHPAPRGPAGRPDTSTDTRKVQLKGRWTIDKKYVGRDIWVAFPVGDDWYLVPHDEMVAIAEAHTMALGTDSWIKGGAYSWPKPTKVMMARCEPYRFAPIARVAAEAASEADA